MAMQTVYFFTGVFIEIFLQQEPTKLTNYKKI